MDSLLEIALRAFTERQRPNKPRTARRKTRKQETRWPETVLLVDTETTTDPSQRLLFGTFRICEWSAAGSLVCDREGLFCADELPQRDPAGYACLDEYAHTHPADVSASGNRQLGLSSRTDFVNQVFYPIAYKERGLVVGFNLPFDLSRLALWAGEARGRFRGGFSLVLCGHPDATTGRLQENRFRPRIGIRPLDSKRTFIGFTRTVRPDRHELIPEGSLDGRPEAGYAFRGHFVDLRTLVFALTNDSYSLQGACEAFGVAHGKGVARQQGSSRRPTSTTTGGTWRRQRDSS